MAPEIIELSSSGSGTAADIWSLGCTIIELVTGVPPYFTLGTMQALFKMVNDPHPPLPTGISKELEAFLLACFTKDFKSRPTAVVLLKHPWITKHVSAKDQGSLENARNTVRMHNDKGSKKPALSDLNWSGNENSSSTSNPVNDDKKLQMKLNMRRKKRDGLAQSVNQLKEQLRLLEEQLAAN